MSRLCRLRTRTHGADGMWAYEEIVKLRALCDQLGEALEYIDWIDFSEKDKALAAWREMKETK